MCWIPQPQHYKAADRENWDFVYALISRRLRYNPEILDLENWWDGMFWKYTPETRVGPAKECEVLA